MRRFWIVLIAVLIVATAAWGAPSGSVSASKNNDTAAAKKKCKAGYHRVHNKCKKTKPVVAPIPTATPVLSFNEQVDAYLARTHFSGSVLLASKGEVLVSKGYGMADREHNTANTPQTQFLLGHVTRQFTAMAVMLLQKQGKLRVNDLICTYLSDCPEAWKPITIHELLNQSSGIPDNSEVGDIYASPEALISHFKHVGLELKPGTQFGFSAPGFVILSAIVAKVSGEPFETFVQKNIFDPLQMTSTGFKRNNVALPHGAVGYGYATAGGKPIANNSSFTFPNAAYGMYSTAEDLFRWDESLGQGALSGKLWTAMFTPYWDITGKFGNPDSFSSVGVGYGWVIARVFNRRLVFYRGGNPDNPFKTGFEDVYNGRYLDDKVTVILLANQQSEGYDTGQSLAAMVFARH